MSTVGSTSSSSPLSTSEHWIAGENEDATLTASAPQASEACLLALPLLLPLLGLGSRFEFGLGSGFGFGSGEASGSRSRMLIVGSMSTVSLERMSEHWIEGEKEDATLTVPSPHCTVVVDVAGADEDVVGVVTVLVFSTRGVRLTLGNEEIGLRPRRMLISGEREVESSSSTSEHWIAGEKEDATLTGSEPHWREVSIG